MLEFRDAHTHLPRLILTQALDPSPSAHQSSCPPQKSCKHAIETLICGKLKRSKFNFR